MQRPLNGISAGRKSRDDQTAFFMPKNSENNVHFAIAWTIGWTNGWTKQQKKGA